MYTVCGGGRKGVGSVELCWRSYTAGVLHSVGHMGYNGALVCEPKRGGEGRSCGVSANEYSFINRSPNKLWGSNSIFNLQYAVCLGPILLDQPKTKA
jgi:hypothetical protein